MEVWSMLWVFYTVPGYSGCFKALQMFCRDVPSTAGKTARKE